MHDPSESERGDSEPIARFLTTRRHYGMNPRRVKPEAFLPSQDGTTSVFRVLGLDPDAVWTLGNLHITQASGRSVHGAAVLSPRTITEAGLQLIRDDNPPLHAAIAGWPVEEDGQLLHALKLADAATLMLARREEQR